MRRGGLFDGSTSVEEGVFFYFKPFMGVLLSANFIRRVKRKSLDMSIGKMPVPHCSSCVPLGKKKRNRTKPVFATVDGQFFPLFLLFLMKSKTLSAWEKGKYKYVYSFGKTRGTRGTGHEKLPQSLDMTAFALFLLENGKRNNEERKRNRARGERWSGKAPCSRPCRAKHKSRDMSIMMCQ